MLTDAPPRKADRAGFLESDRMKALNLPQDGCLLTCREIRRIGNGGREKCRCTPRLRRFSSSHIRVLQNTDMWCPRPCSPTAASPRTLGDRTLRRLQSRNHVDTLVDAHGSAQGNHGIWNIPEHSVPRVLSSSGFPAVQVS